MPNPALVDASHLFNNYMSLTRTMVRSKATPGTLGFVYPPPETEQDVMVFATIYTCVWQAIQDDFGVHYNDATKTAAFQELANIVTPNNSFPYKNFWRQNGTVLDPCPVNNEDGMLWLCRTLRNGFNHFNYRWVDEAPDVYFAKLHLPTPAVIQNPTLGGNYRTFLCDWATSAQNPRSFMAPGSNSRVLETSLGIFRLHLHEFLGLFFQAECGRSHTGLFSLY